MIRDALFEGTFLLLAGTAVLLLSGIIYYSPRSVFGLLGTYAYLFLAACCVVAGGKWITGRIRTLFRIRDNAWPKVALLAGAGILYGFLLTGILSLGWYVATGEAFTRELLWQTVLLSSTLVIFSMFVYEILLMSRERVLDAQVVDQLDRERVIAELTALTHELDPHFMFNSLLTLSQLIPSDAARASLFTSKLSQVYKYVLMNRDRELIALQKELLFIEDYFYLLKIRHDDKLQLHVQVGEEAAAGKMIPPCALQLLVENAIKHNAFSETAPLHIQISLNGTFIRVVNNVHLKPFLAESTRIGLRNLSQRYRLICQRDIVVERNRTQFTVKLPLIQKQSTYDPGNHH